MDRVQARDHLTHTLTRIVKRLDGVYTVKMRDRGDVGRRLKEDGDIALNRLMRRVFRRQSKRVAAGLQSYYPWRKVAPILPADWLEWDDDEIAELIRILLKQTRGGIALFGTGEPVIDYTLTNTQAADWARSYSYELVKGINQTTMDALQSAVTRFVETPGMTIGDVMASLPFDEQRAQMVAVTEITRAYAQGQMQAGRSLAAEVPGVRVVKTWFTNNDDRVCEICGPLDGAEVGLDEQFEGDVDQPPAHPNCRCWISTRTRING